MEEQNQKIGLLLAAVENFLGFNADAPGAAILRKAMAECRAAMDDLRANHHHLATGGARMMARV